MPRQIRFLTAWNCPKLLESGWRLLISLVDIGSTWPVAPSLDYLAPESCMNFSTTGNWSTFTAMSFCFCASESSAGLCNKGAFYRYKNYTWKWFFPIGVTALAPSKLWGMSLSASTHDAYIHKIAAASWSTKVHVDADTFCGKKVKRAVMIVSSEPYRKTSLEVRDACCGLIVFNCSLPYQIGYLCFVIVDFWTCVIVLLEKMRIGCWKIIPLYLTV